MAERLFFPPQDVEGGCSNMSVPAALHDNYLLDELRNFAKLKADIVSHPLYEQLLEAHVSCLCVGLPSDCIQALEAQLANKHNVAIKYLMLGRDAAPEIRGRKEIDDFMETYLVLLHFFKKQLEDLVIPPTTKAMAAYCELEQAFQELTGVSSQTGGTSLVPELVEDGDLGWGMDELGGADGSGWGLEGGLEIQGERDRSLLEHVRDELKLELKEGYLETITAIRKEILRKRQAGKLPGDTSVLKQWWNAHSKWPYPTEDEKRKMVEETGLDLRQINNWFINHRKRNWSGQTIPTDSSTSRTKYFP